MGEKVAVTPECLCTECGENQIRADNSTGFCDKTDRCRAARMRALHAARREGRAPEPRSCSVCGLALKRNNRVGVCSRPGCRAARMRAVYAARRQREAEAQAARTRLERQLEQARAQAQARREARSAAEGRRLAKISAAKVEEGIAWRERFEADRRRRGIPEAGLPVKGMRIVNV